MDSRNARGLQEKISLNCKYCQSDRVIKYGIDKGTQMYYCRVCQRKFARRDTLHQMHTRTADLAEALHLYYSGLSLNDIRRHFIDQDNNYFSKAAIYNWIKRFTDEAVLRTGSFQPEVSGCWLFKEITIGIDPAKVVLGQSYLKSRSVRKTALWLLFDIRSRYLLGYCMRLEDSHADFKVLLGTAVQISGKQPSEITADQSEKLSLNISHETPALNFIWREDEGLISTFDDIIDQRTRFVCALKNQATLEKFLSGWQLDYNYFKCQNRLGGKTPAQTAGINCPYKDWKSLLEGLSVVKNNKNQ
jgi:transposase-like protein